MRKILLSALSLAAVCASAQTLIVNLNNGETMRVPISEIQKMTFADMPEAPGVPLSDFKDPVLREKVAAFDADGDEELSAAEIAQITELNLASTAVESLEGITNLSALTHLNIQSCTGLKNVDLSAGLEKLEYLQAGFCSNLETLVLGQKPALKELWAGYTALTSLDFSGLTALQETSVASTNIESVEINSDVLTYFSAGGANLKSVDLNCPALTELSLSDVTALSGYDISKHPVLVKFTMTGSSVSKFTTEGCPELESLTLNNSGSLWSLNLSKSMKLTYVSCYSCYELESVTMTEGQNIPSLYGISEWMITRIEREWPDDVAPTISDEAFRSLMLSIADKDGDGKITREEAEAVTVLNASGLGLTAVDFFYFNNIEELDLSDNDLETIDLSQVMKVTHLNLNNNKLTSLDVERLENLQYLFAANNKLTTISRLGRYGLIEIDLSNNELTSWSPSYQSNLLRLDMSNNKLTDIALTGDSKLAFLNLSGNALKSVTMWSLEGLVDLVINDNPLNEIPFSDTKNWKLLENIDCSNTDLTALDLHASVALKKVVATGCESLETITLAEGVNAEVVKGDNTTVNYEAAPVEE